MSAAPPICPPDHSWIRTFTSPLAATTAMRCGWAHRFNFQGGDRMTAWEAASGSGSVVASSI